MRGKRWLVRIDVSDYLGIGRGNVPADWTESDRRLIGGSLVPDKAGQTRSIGGGHSRKFLVITPAAAYRLAMRSDKPQAVEFQRWLSDEVLCSEAHILAAGTGDDVFQGVHIYTTQFVPEHGPFSRATWPYVYEVYSDRNSDFLDVHRVEIFARSER